MLPPLGTREQNKRLDRAVSELLAVYGSRVIVERNLIAFLRNASFMRDEDFVSAGRAVPEIEGAGRRWVAHMMHWAVLSSIPLPGGVVSVGVRGGCLEFLAHMTHMLDAVFRTKPFAVFAEATLDTEIYRSLLGAVADFPDAFVNLTMDPEKIASAAPDRISVLFVSAPESAREIEIVEALIPRIVPGGVVMIDDYSEAGFENRRRALDDLLGRTGQSVLEIATAQGLTIWRRP